MKETVTRPNGGYGTRTRNVGWLAVNNSTSLAESAPVL